MYFKWMLKNESPFFLYLIRDLVNYFMPKQKQSFETLYYLKEN